MNNILSITTLKSINSLKEKKEEIIIIVKPLAALGFFFTQNLKCNTGKLFKYIAHSII